MHDCLKGTYGLYNPLLLSVANDTDNLAASAMEFAPGVWLGALLDPENGFAAVFRSESAFARAGLDCREFPCISKIEDHLTSFADVTIYSTRMFETALTMPSLGICRIPRGRQ